jgi:hypothetical protein
MVSAAQANLAMVRVVAERLGGSASPGGNPPRSPFTKVG